MPEPSQDDYYKLLGLDPGEKCSCGHALNDHSSMYRKNWFCDHPDCGCLDFEEGTHGDPEGIPSD